MKPRIPSIIGVVVLLFISEGAHAGVGIFSDPNGSDCNLTLPNFMPTPIYVLYLGQGGPATNGAEYRIAGMPGTLGVSFTATLTPAPGSNLNLGNAFDGVAHHVGWPATQPFDANGNVLLATWVVTNMGSPIPPGTKLTVRGFPINIEQPCVDTPLITDEAFNLICQEGGEMRINGGPPCTVAVEKQTWTRVRNLYR